MARKASTYADGMQRLFSMFPLGLPGIGLLCLRLAVSLSLCVAAQSMHVRFPTVAWLIEAFCFSLLIGLATPVLAAGCAMAGVYAWVRHGAAAWPCACMSIPAAVALALLGPGAYSVDARLFGRKSVVLNNPETSVGRRNSP